MTKLDMARQHCCNFHKGACVFDKPCKPDACKHWPVVAACAAIAAGVKKGAKR